MEACISCSFSKYSTERCWLFPYFRLEKEYAPLQVCIKDIANHLRRTKKSPKSTVKDEKHLLLLAGIIDKEGANLGPVAQSPISTNPVLTLNKTYRVNPGLALIGL